MGDPRWPAVDRRQLRFARIDATADGDNTIVAAVTGRKIRVLSYSITARGTAPNVVTLKSGASTTKAVLNLADNTGLTYAGPYPALETDDGDAFVVNVEAGKDATGHLTYIVTD